jgi:eukaryotic-like serine/threonine-protein kinase
VSVTDPRELLQQALGDRYVVERELGRGGMATVYLARDTKHDRPVALKLLHADLAAALGPERFRREITLAARLQHPHILSVHDSGEGAPGQLWFTMPYVAGETLRARLQRERQLPTHDAVRIAREVAQALDYAHKQGIVHRDIKPENILLTTDGQALVADFGIARAVSSSAETSLTEAGMALGTAQYMSPEQAAGERTIDGRSDVYALGAVLYEMLVGEPPFTGPTTQAIIAKIMSAPTPSVRTNRPGVPQAVDAAVTRALDRVPAERFSTAGEFAQALDVAERAPTGQTPQPRQTRIPVAALALVLGLLMGGGMLFAWRSSHPATATAPEGVRLAVLPFENIGDSTNAYFADGLTDAVRTKLTALPGVEVIASNSSAQYRHTDKSPKQIGQELGVRYLLVGKVRWAKGAAGAAGPGRLQVAPELIDATTATDKWSASYDTTLTDVFQVQGAIATQAATQLGLALGQHDRAKLDSAPTHNVAAYDAYLQGAALLPRTFGFDFQAKRQAIADFRQAVTLDPSFALAWARLGLIESRLNLGDPSAPEAVQSRADIDRALAIDPNLPQAHHALGVYYGNALGDDRRSSAEDSVALLHAPRDMEVIGSLAQSLIFLGRPLDGIRVLERARSIDPRSVSIADRLAGADVAAGRWDDAIAEASRGLSFDPTHAGLLLNLGIALSYRGDLDSALTIWRRVLMLDPASPVGIAGSALTPALRGDITSARQALGVAMSDETASQVVAVVASHSPWLLDGPLADRFLHAPHSKNVLTSVPGDRQLARAQLYRLRGDSTHMRAAADSARTMATAALRTNPDIPYARLNLAIADAYLGHHDDALAEIAAASAAVQPGSAMDAFSVQYELAHIHLILGDRQGAADALVTAMHMPAKTRSIPMLRIDPTWTPLRSLPAFQRLVAEDKPIA